MLITSLDVVRYLIMSAVPHGVSLLYRPTVKMTGFDDVHENLDFGRKRKILNNDFEENRKRFKMNNNADNILTLSPEMMSASEICFVLQERGSDIEDIRCQVVFRLKKIIQEEIEKSKVSIIKEEVIVKEEIVEKEDCLLYTSPSPRDS